MEQKNKLKRNVRIEPKTSTTKTSKKATVKNEEDSIKNNSLARNKADEMENGFVKTRKSPSRETTETNVISKKHNSSTENASVSHTSLIDKISILKKIEKPKNLESNKSNEDTEDVAELTSNKNGFQIILSPSACITAFVTILVTMLFIFLFGLIIGKGMVPAPSKIEPEKLIPQPQTVEEKTEVLPKEKLQFMTNLKKEIVEETPEEIPGDEKDNTSDSKTDKTNKIDTKDKKVVLENKIIPSTRLYDFNLRVAAFRNNDQADTLREKLEGTGFRTLRVIEKDGKGKNWYFVHVLLRGTETKLMEAQESFKKFAIRDSIIKEQTEVK